MLLYNQFGSSWAYPKNPWRAEAGKGARQSVSNGLFAWPKYGDPKIFPHPGKLLFRLQTAGGA
jgi:transposase